jgi:nuclear transcription factor Y gamma
MDANAHPQSPTTGAPSSASSQQHAQHHLAQQHYKLMETFWRGQIAEIEAGNYDFKMHQLPLARIKKVMKADEDVKMISAEAPILFAKACEIMILELTMRAWIHAEENKRRTLQRSDIATAISKSDMFDFLIDIVPRDEIIRGPKSPDKSDYRAMVSPEHSGYQYAYGMQHTGSYPTAGQMADHSMFTYQHQEQLQQYMRAQMMQQPQSASAPSTHRPAPPTGQPTTQNPASEYPYSYYHQNPSVGHAPQGPRDTADQYGGTSQ